MSNTATATQIITAAELTNGKKIRDLETNEEFDVEGVSPAGDTRTILELSSGSDLSTIAVPNSTEYELIK